MKKYTLSALAAAAMACSLASCGDTSTTTSGSADSTAQMNQPSTEQAPAAEPGVMVGGANMVASKNIVENAMASNDHTTLVAAVKQAGLVETLQGPGPFTVFAPTNAAFDAVGKDKVENLMKPENKETLTKVLTYHVVAGRYMAADLKDGMKLKTVEGKELKVSVKDNMIMIDGANVAIADAPSSNGVTHVIDKVLMP